MFCVWDTLFVTILLHIATLTLTQIRFGQYTPFKSVNGFYEFNWINLKFKEHMDYMKHHVYCTL